MPFLKKLTLKHGGKRHQVVVANGTDIVGATDAIEINIEQTVMSRAECVDMIDKIKEKILSGSWPIA